MNRNTLDFATEKKYIFYLVGLGTLFPRFQLACLEPHQNNCKFSSVVEEIGIDPYQEEDPFYPPGKPALSPPAKARAPLLNYGCA